MVALERPEVGGFVEISPHKFPAAGVAGITAMYVFVGGLLKKTPWGCFLFLGKIYVYAFVFRRELKIFT